MEVYEQSNLNVQKPEMGKKLRLVDRVESFLAFDLYDHAAFDYQIGSEAAIEVDRFVNQGNGLLALDS